MTKSNLIRSIELLNIENKKLKNVARSEVCILRQIFSVSFFSSLVNKIYRRFLLRKVNNIRVSDNWTEEEWCLLLKPGNKDLKVVVYTCITGGYDASQKPFIYPDNIDYILYTTEVNADCELHGWSTKPIPEHIKERYNNAMINRYIKFHPHELFSDKYDIAIYIDGNITVVSDLSVLEELMNKDFGLAIHQHSRRNCVYEEVKACIAYNKGNFKNLKRQIIAYKQQGFPANYGLLECNVLVTDLKNEKAKNIYDQWWDELLRSGSGRDQIALPYVLWRNGIKVSDVATLGRNVHRNPKLRVVNHNI